MFRWLGGCFVQYDIPYINIMRVSLEKKPPRNNSEVVILCLSVVDKLCELNGINDFAVLVNTHVA